MAAPGDKPATAARGEGELPVYRLYLLRAGYLLMGAGLAVVEWPNLIGYDRSTPLYEGLVSVILSAMSVLALVGLRYPVQMLPILLFESAWKLIWLTVIALPALSDNAMDAATEEVMVSCLWVALILSVIPWKYVWRHYVVARGDRWR